jgi:hypothetical protein
LDLTIAHDLGEKTMHSIKLLGREVIRSLRVEIEAA